jgi:hypothetical protein
MEPMTMMLIASAAQQGTQGVMDVITTLVNKSEANKDRLAVRNRMVDAYMLRNKRLDSQINLAGKHNLANQKDLMDSLVNYNFNLAGDEMSAMEQAVAQSTR